MVAAALVVGLVVGAAVMGLDDSEPVPGDEEVPLARDGRQEGVPQRVGGYPSMMDAREKAEVNRPVASVVVPVQLDDVAIHRERYVNRSSFGDAWPLTEVEGTLVCSTRSGAPAVKYVLFVDTLGDVYAVSDRALAELDEHSWRDVSWIWSTTSSYSSADIDPLLQAGLRLCEQPWVVDEPMDLPEGVDEAMMAEMVEGWWARLPPGEQELLCVGWRNDPDLVEAVYGTDEEFYAPAFWVTMSSILTTTC